MKDKVLKSFLRPQSSAILLYLLLLLGLGVRLFRLPQQSLWFDEWLVYIALPSFSVMEFFRNLLVYFPEMAVTPVYLGMAYLLSCFIGGHLIALRMLSFFPGLISLVLIFLVGRRLGGIRAGLIATLCLALSPQHIWHNQEIRPYSLLYMFCLLALLGLLYWRESSRLRWFWLNLAANGLLIFTHLFGALFLLPQGFYLLKQGNFRVFMKWAGMHLIFVPLLSFAILVKPYLGDGYHSFPEFTLSFLLFRLFPRMMLRSLCADVWHWHGGVWPWFESGAPVNLSPWLSMLLFLRPTFDAALTMVILGSILLFVVWGGNGWLRAWAVPSVSPNRSDWGQSAGWVLLLTLIFVPSATLAALTLIFWTNFSDYGHDIYVTIGVYLVIGMVLSRLPGNFFRLAVAFLFLLYSFQCLLFLPGSTRTEWRLGARHVRDNASDNDLVLDFWWYGPISREEPYFSDSLLPLRRVNTVTAVCNEAARFFSRQIEIQADTLGEASVWLLVETRSWSEWFEGKQLMPILKQGLHSRGLTGTTKEFAGGFNLAVVRIQPQPGARPQPSHSPSPELWTCDYQRVLADIGLETVSESRREEILLGLEDTIGVWPGVSGMGRLTYPLDLTKTGDLEVAEAMAKYLVLENPSFGLGYLALAMVWAAQGKDQSALAAYYSACSHHLGLAYFFSDYFRALCRDKDLNAVSASLAHVERLVIPLFHETAEYVLHLRRKQQDGGYEHEAEMARVRDAFLDDECSAGKKNATSVNSILIPSAWDGSLISETPSQWIYQMFNRQTTVSRLADLFPFHKRVTSLYADTVFRLTGNVDAAVKRYRKLIRKFPFEKRFYDKYNSLLLRRDDAPYYVQQWLDCVGHNPEIIPFAAEKLSDAGLHWYSSGCMDAAIRAYAGAIALEPQNPTYALRLGQLYDLCGDHHRALYYYEKAYKNAPEALEINERICALLILESIDCDEQRVYK